MSEALIRVQTRAVAERLRLLRSLVRETAASAGLGDDGVRDVVLAVDEACQNVVRHAYAQAQSERPLELEVLSDAGSLTFVLRDAGRAVDLDAIRPGPPDALRPGGRGLYLIRQVMDRVEHRPGPGGTGNELRLSKLIPREAR
ncbi:MAG TPA: ATP-binding protein [Gammaproteobacteria bacterium]